MSNPSEQGESGEDRDDKAAEKDGTEQSEAASEKEQLVREEDEHGCLLVYPAWSKKNAPAEKNSKWEVPVYL